MTMEQTAVVAFPNHETAIAFGATRQDDDDYQTGLVPQSHGGYNDGIVSTCVIRPPAFQQDILIGGPLLVLLLLPSPFETLYY
jgi:hypothetical protein